MKNFPWIELIVGLLGFITATTVIVIISTHTEYRVNKELAGWLKYREENNCEVYAKKYVSPNRTEETWKCAWGEFYSRSKKEHNLKYEDYRHYLEE